MINILNQVILVGRLTKDVILEQIDDDKFMAITTIAIPRAFKNENGEYDTDIVDIEVFGGVASNMSEYCKKGDIIGIKGRVESDEKKTIRIVAEKVTFLSSSKPLEDEAGKNEVKEEV